MMERIKKVLNDNSVEYVLLNTSHAFHSSQFDVILDEFANYVNQFVLKPPKGQFLSCLTGEFADKMEVTTGKYWAKQLRTTVQFNKGIETIQNGSECVFIEAGPNTHLSGLTKQNARTGKDTKVISSIGNAARGNTYVTFLESIGNIWTAGLSPDFNKFHEVKKARFVRIPHYAFEKKRYWIDVDREKLKKAYETGTYDDSDNDLKRVESVSEDSVVTTINTNYSAVEKTLLELWMKSLGTDNIDLNDNFFELGGDSLLAVTVISRMKSVFKIDLSLRTFLNSPRIKDLAEKVEALQVT